MQILLVLLHLCDAGVEGGDFRFSLLEEPVGLQEVIHRGHEKRKPVLPGQDAGEGGEIAHFARVGLHHQHAEHLPLAPFGVSGQILLHLFRRPYAQGMRRVAEGVGKPRGQGYAADVCMKRM